MNRKTYTYLIDCNAKGEIEKITYRDGPECWTATEKGLV